MRALFAILAASWSLALLFFGSSGWALTTPAMILPKDPYSLSGNDRLPYDTNLTSYLLPVVLEHLEKKGLLANEHLEIFGSPPSQLVAPDGDLSFLANDPRFLQVNAYYHLDHTISDLKSEGLFPKNYQPIKVDVSPADEKNNAGYYYDQRLIKLGPAELSNQRIWSANDPDIIVHEFGHSLNARISDFSILVSHSEAAAFDEGMADFWAYSQNGNPRIGDWFLSAVVLGWGLAPNKVEAQRLKTVRDLSKTWSYPDALTGENHDDSRIISSVLVDFSRSGIARHTMMILQSRLLSDLQMGDSFAQIAFNLRHEAHELGISDQLIEDILRKHGLLHREDVSPLQVNEAEPICISEPDAVTHCTARLRGKQGYTVDIIPNLINDGADLGNVTASLTTTASPDELTLLKDRASFFRVKHGPSVIEDIVATTSKEALTLESSKDQAQAILRKAGFTLRFMKPTHKSYEFTLTLVGWDSVDNEPTTKDLKFNISIDE